MASLASEQKVQQLYIAYFGRPADPGGLAFYADALDNGTTTVEDIATSFGQSVEAQEAINNLTTEEFIELLYQQAFSRDYDPALDGTFWIDAINSGATTKELAFIQILEGAQGSDLTAVNNKVQVAQTFTDQVEILEYDTAQERAEAKAMLANVTHDPATLLAGNDAAEQLAMVINSGGAEFDTFTLKEIISVQDLPDQSPTQTVIYWGYNPHAHGENGVDNLDGNNPDGNDNNLTNEGPFDGGVPLSVLFDYIENLVGLDFAELGLINVANGEDDESTQLFPDVNDINVTNNGDGTATINVTLTDGTVNTAEVAISEQYFEFLYNALFDAEGNSRLFEKEVPYMVQAQDADGNPLEDFEGNPILVPAVIEGESIVSQSPIVLTPLQNNGGTEENGFTGGNDNTIVVGRLDLLHGAYIDAGGGNNTLEIDAKGYFAQPKQLLNIQNVVVNNLPNIYTVRDDDGNIVSQYPDLTEEEAASLNSVIDLSRAVDIEALTVTEDGFLGLEDDTPNLPGMLTVAGIRNGVTTTLDGGFIQSVMLHYGAEQGAGVNLVLNNVDFRNDATLSVAQNAEELTLETTGGNSYISTGFLGGELNLLTITGTEHLFIDGDLDASFRDETPVTIDASANTGGVDLKLSGSEIVTFLGSEGDDRFRVETDESGSDFIGVGPDENSATIVDMSGDNFFEVLSANIDVTVGDGNNTLELEGQNVTAVAGDGNNIINADDSGVVSITTGAGDDLISAVRGESVTIAAGDGDNDITVSAEEIAITTGAGNDNIVVSGMGLEELGNADVIPSPTALINIDTGAGEDTVVLGRDVFGDGTFFGITALAGSSISGENITLFVENPSDLRAAELEGITSVILNHDVSDSINQAPGAYELAPLLTLTDAQFAAIGADNFSVYGAEFSTYAQIKIIVTESTTATDLGIDDLPAGVDVILELQDGVQLEISAQQLHERVAPEGIILADDNNTDTLSGSVLITDAGTDFDPFNTNDQARTEIDGQTYYGGSLSPEDFANDANNDGDITRTEWGSNVLVDRELNGYNRPADAPSYSRLTIDSDEQGGELGPFSTIETFLRFVGDADLEFTPMEGGRDDWGRPIEGGSAIALGIDNGVPTNDFIVDFSAMNGNLTGLTLANFENVEEMYGNDMNARVNVEINDGQSVASSDAGLISRGIATYVVTSINDDAMTTPVDMAEFWTSRVTEDLEVLGLQGNYEDTIIFGNTERGVSFLMEVAYDKFDGYAVGTLVADFARPDANAVIDVVNIDAPMASDEVARVAGIDVTDANTATVNIEGGNTIIESFSGDELSSLTVTADADVSIETDLPASLEVFDAAGVDGELSVTIDLWNGGVEDGLAFTGAAGGTELTIDDATQGSIASIDGAGIVNLTIGDGVGSDNVDLTETTLGNIGTVTLNEGSTLSVTFDQADAITPANFIYEGADGAATLNLVGLNDQVFALADYPEGLDVTLTLAELPTVTLNPLTDLTGIAGLVIPEGTTLFLTMEQFQQLDDEGTLTGLGNVVITDVTQASVGENGEDLDLTDITIGGTVTLELAEDVDLSESALLPTGAISGPGIVDTFEIGGFTLTLGDIQNANGAVVNGEAGSTLTFVDTNAAPFEAIDASGFNIETLRLLNVLVADRNVDLMFTDLPEAVTKVFYTGLGFVEGVTQNVIIEEGTTIPGFLVFNIPNPDVELRFFNLTMEGGTEIDGNLRLSQDPSELGQVQVDLQSITINSVGTAENLITGNTANIIAGDITSQGVGIAGSVDNDLLEVNINAEQDFVVEGQIIFESTVGNDGITANDDDEATATLNVDGSANVTLGDLDTDDNDVDFLVVNHEGTGTLTFGLSSLSTVDATDLITVNGSAAGDTIINISGELDLSDDVLINVDQLILDESGSLFGSADVSLTITQAQLDAIGATNIVVNEDGQTTYLNINEFGSAPFDATVLDENIDDIDIFMAEGVNTLDPSTNLTGVDTITVPEGGVLNLTAAQFQQLQGSGTIVGLDEDGNVSTDYTVNITGLTQADIDNGQLDLSDITADNVTLSLAENVELSDDDVLDLDVTSNGEVEILLADTQQLGVATFDQADGLDVTGTGDTDVFFRFMDENGSPVTFASTLDASGYSVTQLHALNVFVGGFNVEFLLDDLDQAVELVVYFDPEQLGMLNTTNRVVIVEPGTSVGNNAVSLAFNDLDQEDEVITLTLNLLGGVEMNGDLVLGGQTPPAGTMPLWLQNVTIVSEGDGSVPNAITGELENIIDGDITPFPAGLAPGLENNNLLDVDILATEDLIITGDILLNRRDADTANTGTVTVSGTADVTIKSVDSTLSDEALGTVTVVNNGTGTLTFTAGSDAVELNDTENLVFEGTGNIVLDTDPTPGNNGVDGGDELSNIDASAMSGDLSLSIVENIDSADFTFTTGTGVTTATFIDGDLDSTGTDATPGTADDTNGWTFDYSNAAAGSELHLAPATENFVAGSVLNINMGPNGTLFIDSDMDLSDLDLEILGAQSIVLADEVTLTLSAAQASELNIISGVDADNDGILGTVNINNLANGEVYDFSGISGDIAGTITLAEDDVTVDAATDLGEFSITLNDIQNPLGVVGNKDGQTIRFSTEDQAARDVIVIDGDDANFSSANVIWLFDSISGPVDTSGYDGELARLFVTEALINNEGGDVENLFTTLPNTILRVDFVDLDDLLVLLNSNAVNRVVELVHFTQLNDLTFSDVGATPDEFIQNLTLNLGGEVVIGNVDLDNVIGGMNIDPDSIEFQQLTINSVRAVKTDDVLAAEGFLNNNNGINENLDENGNVDVNGDPENAQPDNINTVGDIGIGANNGLDLLDVLFDTGAITVIGGGSSGEGAALEAGTITFDSEDAGAAALFTLEGANDVTIKAIDATDADITSLTVDNNLAGAVYTVTGGSPAIELGPNLEVFTLDTIGGVNVNTSLFGTEDDGMGNLYAGVAGEALSELNVTGGGIVDLGVLAVIDSNDDDTNNDMIPDQAAFTLNGNNGAEGTGVTTATLGAANVNGAIVAPTLEEDSTWVFNDVNLTVTEDVTFEVNTTLEVNDGSLTLTDNVDLTGVTLDMEDAELVIEGDNVDLSGATLNLTNTPIVVPEDGVLVVTVDQYNALGPVTGSGTIQVVGDATDTAILNNAVKVVNLDFSGVTIDTMVDADGLVNMDFAAATSEDDMGTVGGFNITGTDFDDDILASAEDDIINMGLGDDQIAGNNGSDTYIINDGVDTIDLLVTDSGAGEEDVLVVGAGAEAIAGTLASSGGFIATADTMNDGIATITAVDGQPMTLDVSLAGGANGFTLIGNTNDENTLVGSDQDDIIESGDSTQTGVDTLTGNDGADLFVFEIDVSTPATAVQNVVAIAIDRETLSFVGTTDTDDGTEELQVNYTLNGALGSVTITDPAVDFNSPVSIAEAVANALNAVPGLIATDDGAGVVTLEGEDGNSVAFANSTWVNISGFAEAINNGTDQAQITELEIGAAADPVVENEVYSVEVMTPAGNTASASYVALAGDTVNDVANGLATNINTALGVEGINVTAAAVNNVITFTDNDADNGGFTLTFDGSGAFNGSGASGNTLADLSESDIITDFTTNEDQIDLGLAAGTALNYAEAAEVADFATALADANGAFNGTVQYYLTSTAADEGMLFFDANLDGTADGVLSLLGVNAANFAETDIAGV